VTDKEANIYAAENRMRDGIRFFQKWTILSWGDVEDFTMAAIRDTERESLFELYETYQAQGIPLPSAIPTLKRTLRVHFRSSFETDPLTAMAAIVVPTETRDPLSWKVFEGDPLTENLTEGEYIRISGPPGKGKTNLGCVLMERWIKKGCRAFSNIRLEVPNHVYVSRTSELLRAIVQARRDGISWLFLLDEPRIAGPLEALGAWVEARYRVTPRVYVAGRVDHLGFSSIRGTLFEGAPTPWEEPVTRLEAGGGYYVRRNIVVRAVYQYNHRDDSRTSERHFVAAQGLYWF